MEKQLSVFQNDFDLASLELNHRIKTDIQRYFEATKYSLVTTESITKGLLAHSVSDLVPKAQNMGGIVCDGNLSYKSLCQLSGRAIPALPNAEFASELAKHMADQTQANVSISLLGIIGIPKDNVLSSKIFIGYCFNNNVAVKMLELSGTMMSIFNQSILAALGFLQTLFLKYTKAAN